ncbi:hypothetical protein DPMN_041554 [Dreissena polymorpha]|uniref:Uncharacterized protein n=1 Tax=Dreissena polymorpha TaxID=45954 RepID=A0A9D4D0F0_DREPO|nr:hypothetical protein DPMN_041554 [Dreissena polymorpha]
MSGESDTESDFETNLQTYKCHICNFKPNFGNLIYILEQIVEIRPYLINLPNGQLYVRCQFDDCESYYHLKSIYPSFPDESLNYDHLDDHRENGMHCPKCEPFFVVCKSLLLATMSLKEDTLYNWLAEEDSEHGIPTPTPSKPRANNKTHRQENQL